MSLRHPVLVELLVLSSDSRLDNTRPGMRERKRENERDQEIERDRESA